MTAAMVNHESGYFEAQAQENYETKKRICKHPVVYGGFCATCDHLLECTSGVPLNYVAKGLRVSNDAFARIREIEFQYFLSKRKLCLVLDLDHTLLHTTRTHSLSPHEEEYLKKQSDSVFYWESTGMLTKLRPFVHKFLAEASKLCEMYIYTMGDRAYASRMANLLDPDNIYFNSMLISREDCTQKGQKGLDVVPVPESVVLIVDDKKSVWSRHSDNVIQIEEYNYFSTKAKECLKSILERSDESEASGGLNSVLEVIKRVHSIFYGRGINDVRQILKDVRKDVLKGCKIVLPEGVRTTTTERCQLLRMAEEMGAMCLDEYGVPLATHVVYSDSNTTVAWWGVLENKFLVSPEWIVETYYKWRKQPEDDYTGNGYDAGGIIEDLESETTAVSSDFFGFGNHSGGDDELLSLGSPLKRQRCMLQNVNF